MPTRRPIEHRPAGMPIYWRPGDDPAMFRRAERYARKWATAGISEDELDRAVYEYHLSGAAEFGARAAGRPPIDWSFIRAMWFARDCFRHERARIAQGRARYPRSRAPAVCSPRR